MPRKIASTLTIALVAVIATNADAFWWTHQPTTTSNCETGACQGGPGVGDRVRGNCAENNAWPQQFIEQDRMRVQAPFELMVRNGWRRQNLLGQHHFSADGTELTDAGKLRVQWIVTQPPTEFRQVFIERSLSDEVNQARHAAAETFAVTVLHGSGAPMINESTLISQGRPATMVNFVNTSFRDNMPVPTLPGEFQNLDSGN